jgi:hypothetical protein
MVWLCLLIAMAAVTGFDIALPHAAWAHRELFSPAEKGRLQAANRIQVDALALNDQGPVDPAGVVAIAGRRLGTLGYGVSVDAAQPHDVVVKIKCEQQKTWEGPVTSGGDADQPDAGARLWKGPACQISYRLDSHASEWRREIRGAGGTVIPGGSPLPADRILSDLAARLAEDPFPYLLAAEWGQSSRLLAALDDSAITSEQRRVIVTLLGQMAAVDAIPALSRTLKASDPALAQQAAVALGAIGHGACIPVLLEQLTHESPAVRLAAIHGLGRLAPLHPASPIVPALLKRLREEPVSTQIEIVRALGMTTDRRILEPLRTLNRSVQGKTRFDGDPELKELQRVLGQTLDQFDGVHTEE